MNVIVEGGMPIAQLHRGHPKGNRSDWASAREKNCRFSLEGGVVVTALCWLARLAEVSS
jgi:hypothetical protein